jgi:O-antigen ligase
LFVALPRKRSLTGVALLLALVGMIGALMLAVTRASWLAFAISTALILLVSVSRRAVLVAGVLAIPLILAGLFVLQQKRNVGFIDPQDQSTSWRETVWREGFHLLVSKPRHLLVGIGMDSIKAHWREWGMFDKGRLPWGHMHSNLLQIALERGLPALIVWLGLLFIYARTIWRMLREKTRLDWIEHGILLGALGGLVGFFISGLVHYNWGDSEVIMIFYFVMGLVMALNHKLASNENEPGRTEKSNRVRAVLS